MLDVVNEKRCPNNLHYQQVFKFDRQTIAKVSFYFPVLWIDLEAAANASTRGIVHIKDRKTNKPAV